MGNVLSLACFSPTVSFKTTKKRRITRKTASQETIKVDVNESREDIGPLPTPQVSAAGITVRAINLIVSVVEAP